MERMLSLWRVSSRFRLLVLGIVVALGAVLPFINGLNAPLTYDDVESLVDDVDTRSLQAAWRTPWPRRFAMWTFAVNHGWAKDNLAVYRGTNVALHLLAGWCLFGLAERILSAPRVPEWTRRWSMEMAAAIALIWVVHPLHTESVTYVIQRFESLAGMLMLLTLWLAARSWDVDGWRSWLWRLTAMFAAWLAFQSKETAAVLPALALALDRCCFGQDWREVGRRQWTLHLFLFGGAAWTVSRIGLFATNEFASAGLGMEGLTPWSYLRSQPGVILHYLGLAFWPQDLCIDYRWPVTDSAMEIYGLGAVILAMLGTAGFWMYHRPPLGFAAAAFFILLAPTSSIVPIQDLAVEHRMYVPLASVIGLAVVAVIWTARRIARRQPAAWPFAMAGVVLSVAVVAFSLRTYVRNRDYVEPTRLWSQPLARNPGNLRARTNLAVHMMKAGRLDESLAQLAILEPSMPNSAQLQVHFGIIELKRGNRAEAARRFQKAVTANPRSHSAWFNLGSIHFGDSDWKRAAECFRTATDLNSRYEEAWGALGWSLENCGDDRGAIDCFRRALELDPGLLVVPVRLADLLATSATPDLRDPVEALRLSEALARRTRGRNRYVLDTLGAAYAANGRFADAVKAARRALQLQGDKASETRLRSRLEAYEAGRPAERATTAIAAPGSSV